MLTTSPMFPDDQPLTAICWGTQGPVCTAYIQFQNGSDTGFTEYASRGAGVAWGPTGTPIYHQLAQVKPNTPIVAVSTLDVGGADTWLFFVSQGNTLRFFKNTEGPANWILGDTYMNLGGDIQSLTATTWSNNNGQSESHPPLL